MSQHVLVVLSGGQDSTTVLWMMAHQNTVGRVSAVTIDYGQRHQVEVDAAQAIWSEFQDRFPEKAQKHEVISVPYVLAGTSPLVSPESLKTYTDRASMEAEVGEQVEQAFVPMRNLLFIVLAANRAIVWGCDAIALGVCEQDATNFPDCRQEFIDDAQVVLDTAVRLPRPLNILTPLIQMPKEQAIREGLKLPGWYRAMRLTRTSYAGEYPPRTRDHASVLREDSFQRAGVADPMVVQAALEGLCPMPPGLGAVRTFEDAERMAGAAP